MSASASGNPYYADMYTASPNNKIEHVEKVYADLFPMINHFKLVRERKTPVPQAYLSNHNMTTKEQCVGTNSPSGRRKVHTARSAGGKECHMAETEPLWWPECPAWSDNSNRMPESRQANEKMGRENWATTTSTLTLRDTEPAQGPALFRTHSICATTVFISLQYIFSDRRLLETRELVCLNWRKMMCPYSALGRPNFCAPSSLGMWSARMAEVWCFCLDNVLPRSQIYAHC